MHRKYVILPGKELFFACERLLLFRYPKPRVRSFRRDTRASRATSFISSTAVIWYTVLFRQNRTDRPYERVEIHNDRARQMGREASLTITQWLTTLNHYDWRCA